MKTALQFYCEQTNKKENELNEIDLKIVKMINQYAIACIEYNLEKFNSIMTDFDNQDSKQ
jgi:hypothetical protein